MFTRFLVYNDWSLLSSRQKFTPTLYRSLFTVIDAHFKNIPFSETRKIKTSSITTTKIHNKEVVHEKSCISYNHSVVARITSTHNINNPVQNKLIKSAKRNLSTTKKKKKFIPPKAILNLTPKARDLFRKLLANVVKKDDSNIEENDNTIIGIMLKFKQSSSGEPRMVFQFNFVAKKDIGDEDEPVSLELLDDGITPKNYRDSLNDGLPKFYVHSDAIMKVLGTTVDINEKDGVTPLVIDRDGNVVDPDY